MGLLFQKMTILGVGLVGGSLALACKTRGLVGEICGVGRGRANLEKARALGVVDAVMQDPAEGVRGADLVVLATPVGSFVSLVKAIAPALRPGVIVTDVGSVKGDLVRELEDLMPPGARFVGSHPIAGSERFGVEAASPLLFEGAQCVLTPTSRTDRQAFSRIKVLWEQVGSLIVEMDPHTHDRVFAAVSHLPHVVAYALVEAVLGRPGGEDLAAFVAGGFRDVTRIASSHPDLWRDICLRNRESLLREIEGFQTILSRFREAIAREDGEDLFRRFEAARKARERLQDKGET
ncbi:MAG: prephenate dehydrogenase/arogenate dehydrogenase family protein [Nitrospirae bacterium]|nr:prephenate dehydrogenase/arogenate dehydrogenase family protein [Nitrospirota bacterium]